MVGYENWLRHIAFERKADLPAPYRQAVFDEGLRAHDEVVRARGLKTRKVLVIGGAGYIGTELTSHLLDHGYTVRATDVLLYNNQVCVLPFLRCPRYEFVYGDLVDADFNARALEGVTDVVILAGLVGDPVTKRYPEVSEKINVEGIRCLIDQLDGCGLNKVIFVSTCSNYGFISDDEIADEDSELKPLSLYAEAKVKGERQILSLKGKVDYHPIVLRFATAFGLSPRMRFDLTINEFTREIYYGKELLVYDAETWRPYCHVSDFALVIRRALEAPIERVSFEIFNAGGEANNLTKRTVVDTILDFLPGASVRYQAQGKDPRNYRVNFSKIRKILYFESTYKVEDGVRELIAALEQNLFPRVDENRRFYGNYEIEY